LLKIAAFVGECRLPRGQNAEQVLFRHRNARPRRRSVEFLPRQDFEKLSSILKTLCAASTGVGRPAQYGGPDHEYSNRPIPTHHGEMDALIGLITGAIDMSERQSLGRRCFLGHGDIKVYRVWHFRDTRIIGRSASLLKAVFDRSLTLILL
jgi:hypothetical protein